MERQPSGLVGASAPGPRDAMATVLNIPAHRSSSAAGRSGGARASSARPKTRWTVFKATVALVPWLAVFAGALFISGAVIFAVYAQDAADQTQTVLDEMSSDTSQGLLRFMAVFEGSWIATAALAGACLAGSWALAGGRLNLRLRLERGRGPWAAPVAAGMRGLGALALLLVLGTAGWVALNTLFLAAMQANLVALGSAAEGAAATTKALQAYAANYTAVLSDFRAQLAAGLDAAPPAAAATAASGFALLEEMNPGAAPGGASANAAEGVTTTLGGSLVCPAQGCLNADYFSWLESSACVCGDLNLARLQDDTNAAVSSVKWAMIGAALLWGGCMLAGAQCGGDRAAIAAADEALRERSAARRAGGGRGAAAWAHAKSAPQLGAGTIYLPGERHKAAPGGAAAAAPPPPSAPAAHLGAAFGPSAARGSWAAPPSAPSAPPAPPAAGSARFV